MHFRAFHVFHMKIETTSDKKTKLNVMEIMDTTHQMYIIVYVIPFPVWQ